MENTYTAKEILQMAVQSKIRGVELYLELARNSENYHVGRLFMELAKDEQRHRHDLEKWLDRIKEGGREEAYPGEKSLYLKALVDSNAFRCGAAKKQVLEKTISEEEALQAGITFEKDFMLFLHELRQHVVAEDAKTIDDLIKEEVRHLGEIFHLKDDLEKGKGK